MHALARLNKHTLYPAPLLWLALYLGEKQQQLKNLPLHLIPCFSICHIKPSQKLGLANPGSWQLREPRGLRTHASCVTKAIIAQGLVLRVESHSSHSSQCPLGSAKRAQKQNIQASKGTRWDLHN